MGLLLLWGACEYGNPSAVLDDGSVRVPELRREREKLSCVGWESLPVPVLRSVLLNSFWLLISVVLLASAVGQLVGTAEPGAFAGPAFGPGAGCVSFRKQIAELGGSEAGFVTPNFFLSSLTRTRNPHGNRNSSIKTAGKDKLFCVSWLLG